MYLRCPLFEIWCWAEKLCTLGRESPVFKLCSVYLNNHTRPPEETSSRNDTVQNNTQASKSHYLFASLYST